MRDCEVSYRQNDAPPIAIPLEDNALSLQSLTDPVLPIGRKASLPLINALDGGDISLIKTGASVNAHTWEPRDISIVFGK